jgi:hypothetical protein
MEQVGCIPYPKTNSIANDFATFGDRKAILNAQVNRLNISNIREIYESYIKFTDENPTIAQTFVSYEFNDHKKFSSIPSNATAFYSRKPFYNVVIVQRWINEQDDKLVYDWSKNIQRIANKDGYDNKSCYINFESPMGDHYDEEKMKEIFGENLKKLKELKRKYDPNVFFRKGAVVLP